MKPINTSQAGMDVAEDRKSRHRLPISCVQCRRRKRRCDRQNPCQTCVHRGEADTCSYEGPKLDKLSTRQTDNIRSDNDKLRERVRQLELILHDHVQELENISPLTASRLARSVPRMVVDKELPPTNQPSCLHKGTIQDGIVSSRLACMYTEQRGSVGDQAMYKTLTSWNSILSKIDFWKDVLETDISDLAHPNEGHDLPLSISVLPAGLVHTSVAQIVLSLPERSEMDRLVSQYFQSYYPFCPIIHPSQFKQHYQSDNFKSDLPSLSQVFGMMALATVNNDPDDLTADHYAQVSLRALELSGFIIDFNLTTVVCLINLMSFYQRERQQDTFIWSLLGLALQIARALGLHRDPSFLGISGIQAQLRRSIWISLISQDMIYAARYGRSTTVYPGEWDTQAPSDEEIVGGSLQSIPFAYMRANRLVSMAVAKLLKQLLSPKATISYDRLLELESELKANYATVPASLPDDSSRTALNYLALQWLYERLSPFYLAYALIIAHRPFLLKDSARYEHSRVVCLQAARDLLSIAMQMAEQSGLDHWAWHVRDIGNIAYEPAVTCLCVGLYLKARSMHSNPSLDDTERERCDSDHALIRKVLSRINTQCRSYSNMSNIYAKVMDVSGMPTMPSPTSDPAWQDVDTQSDRQTELLDQTLAVGGQHDWNNFINSSDILGDAHAADKVLFSDENTYLWHDLLDGHAT